MEFILKSHLKRSLLFIVTVTTLRADLALFWWQPKEGSNFGDELSRVLIERMIHRTPKKSLENRPRLLAIGSIVHFAKDGDTIRGSGINGKHLNKKDYPFKQIDIRAVRGPLTRNFLLELGFEVPEVYGDPALLLPYFFPEFKKNPIREYLIIPHISEMHFFRPDPHVAYPTEPWHQIVQKIVESKKVISSSLHGVIVAEAFGIPAILLRLTDHEPLFKFIDYYQGTGRNTFNYARSIKETLHMPTEQGPVFNFSNL